MSKPVVLITGASSGIGAATARLLGRRGFRLALTARRIERLKALVEEIRSEGGTATSIQADISKLPQVKDLVHQVGEKYGRIDILINNAGMGRLKWLDELDPLRDISYQIAVNLTGTIHVTRLVLPTMLDRGQGQIITVSSAAAWVAPPTYSIYTASKFGVKGFSESLRREVQNQGIHVGMIYPGPVATEFDQHAGVSWETEKTTPSWMLLEAEEVAQAIYRLIRTKKRRIILPWPIWVAVWGNMLFPCLGDWVFSRFFKRGEGSSMIWGEHR
ncbi:MAG: SDR family oxidoreductase [Anaerolineales bacterium]